MNTYQEKCEAQYLELKEVKQENEKLKQQLKNAEEIVYTQARRIEKQNKHINKIEPENEKLKLANTKLEKAIKALEEISKETCKVGMYKEPTNEARIAIEALKEIKGELDE